MSTVARFDTDRMELTPGGESTYQLTVVNQSQIVEAYRVEPAGELAPFTRVTPEQLSLYPNTEGTVALTFSLPVDSAVSAGEVPFAVMVRPQEQVDDLVVPETTAIVLPYSRIDAELTPRTSQARLWGKHFLAIDNRGNFPVEVRLSGTDPNDALAVRCRPKLFTVRPGQAVFSTVRVRPRRLMWRGQPATRPFQVSVEPDVDDGFPVDGQVVQEPIFPRGTGKLVMSLVAAAIALVALWYGLLRPTIASTAQDAVSQPLQQVKKQAAQAKQQAKQAAAQAGLAGKKSAQASQSAKKSAKAQAAADSVKPLNKRLIVTADPKATEMTSFVVAEKQVISVTDLVFESRGDAGTVQLLRDDDQLITAQTEDFRTLDQHFVSPIIYTAGQRITLRLTCQQPVQDQKQC
ncbi:MAG: hypothetical protein ACRDQ5_10810, partial [Sciscionella sp.]